MGKDLYKSIQCAQQGNKNDMLELITEFRPLISKHSLCLKGNDAKSEVTLAFIEIIHKINLSGFNRDNKNYALIYYIKKSIQNASYSLSHKNHLIQNMNVEFDDRIKVPFVNESINLQVEFKDMFTALTPLQKNVIVYKYYYGYSDAEIGNQMSVSRQAVNRIKIRALTELKNMMQMT
ncbi:MAG: sigma-70 family RNA polymerase sigma factor [Oscillospiraceae bacterium]